MEILKFQVKFWASKHSYRTGRGNGSKDAAAAAAAGRTEWALLFLFCGLVSLFLFVFSVFFSSDEMRLQTCKLQCIRPLCYVCMYLRQSGRG